MGRLITTAALLAALLASPVLSGCSGDGGASTPTPSPTPTSTSPTASPTPQPPAMPEAARAHTEAGAIAFVEHYWHIVNYSLRSPDLQALKALSMNGCRGCMGGIQTLQDIKSSGGTINGGDATITDLKARGYRAGNQIIYEVTFKHTNEPEFDDYPGTERDVHRGSSTKPMRMKLFATPDAWQVAELEVSG